MPDLDLTTIRARAEAATETWTRLIERVEEQVRLGNNMRAAIAPLLADHSALCTLALRQMEEIERLKGEYRKVHDWGETLDAERDSFAADLAACRAEIVRREKELVAALRPFAECAATSENLWHARMLLGLVPTNQKEKKRMQMLDHDEILNRLRSHAEWARHGASTELTEQAALALDKMRIENVRLAARVAELEAALATAAGYAAAVRKEMEDA